MGMGTVAETAVTTDLKDLAEIMIDLFFLKIDRSEALDTRRIDDTSIRQEIHLREGRGVHTFVVRIGDLTGTGHLASEQRIE